MCFTTSAKTNLDFLDENFNVSELRWQLSTEDLEFCEFSLHKLASLKSRHVIHLGKSAPNKLLQIICAAQ